MDILSIGDYIRLTDITFEDSVYDIEDCHPGIVLIPTSCDDDFAYCLYMTSDKSRFMKDKDRYFRCYGIYKTSYINLGHIIKIPNAFKKVKKNLDESVFRELLEAVYDYHMENGETEEFKEIKNKIEIILELFEAKKDNECIEIDDENIKICKGQPRENIPLLMYIKYRDSIPTVSRYEKAAMQVNRVKSKLENYINNCYKKSNIEKTKEFYEDLKMFNNSNLKEILGYAMALLKADRRYTDFSQDLESEFNEFNEINEIKMRKKQEKSMQRNLRKAQEEKERIRMKKLEKGRRMEEKYGKFNFDFK